MIRKMLKDKWSYVGLALMAVGAFVLTACSGMKLSVESGEFKPSFLTEAGKAINDLADATGIPWLKIAAGAVTTFGGAGLMISRAVKAHDAKPFVGTDGKTATEAELVDSLKKP